MNQMCEAGKPVMNSFLTMVLTALLMALAIVMFANSMSVEFARRILS